MPYFVLIAGVVIIVLIWVSHVQSREQVRELERRERAGETNVNASFHRNNLAGQFIPRIVGTVAVLAGMWFWGVESLIEQRQQDAFEQEWLATFVDEHQREFNADCEAIMARINPITGVAFDRDTGEAVSVLTCTQSWSPPEIPDEFSTSRYDQPGRVPPFPSGAIFGENLGKILCADPSNDDTCFMWEDFVEPPTDIGY